MLLDDFAAAVGVKNVLREDKVVGMPLCVASWLAGDEDCGGGAWRCWAGGDGQVGRFHHVLGVLWE